jgi:hypothetical protein
MYNIDRWVHEHKGKREARFEDANSWEVSSKWYVYMRVYLVTGRYFKVNDI